MASQRAEETSTPPGGLVLGPYALERPLGRGGMGEVWRATHLGQGVAVALKVLTGDRARDERFRRTLRAEIRAVATLAHPNIARILDHGEVPSDSSGALPGPFAPGSPYLVLELVEGGSLRGHCGRLSWEATRWVLTALLDALAHAHARGVVHRDLKPENVLLGRWTASVKLTDFGLAFPFETPDEARALGRFAGTPAFMAPEQAEGRWRDYGPWTDLYGLGCLAYALATGAAPFSGSVLDILGAHLGREVPPLVGRAALPAGFEGWVLSLLEKDPADRPQRAADALRALRALGGPEPDLATTPPELFQGELPEISSFGGTQGWTQPSGPRAPLVPAPRPPPVSSPLGGSTLGDTWAELSERPALGISPLTPTFRAESEEGPTAPHRRVGPPEVPESWRQRAAAREGEAPGLNALRGVGLGLFGLRVLPVVAREAERDDLWDSLRAVGREGRARAVVLHGAEGVGKSRLAAWLCEMAEEIGAASALRAIFARGGGSGGGFEMMLERHYRSTGLSREDVMARVAARLRLEGVRDHDELLALTELVRPATPEELQRGARRIRFGSPIERHALIRRALERLAAERPLVLWLDGADHDPDALAWCRHLLDAQDWEPSPILVVLTATDAPTGGLAPELGALVELPEVERLNIGPLGPEATATLVREVLGLEGELAHQVEARAAGNAQFAVQLVGHWAERGLLIAGERGFHLREGAPPAIPEALTRVWEERVARLLEERSAVEAASLELAAVLGQDVRAEERWAALRVAELPGVPDLVEQLLASGLAWPADGGLELGWSFAHGAVRAVLEARAEAAGRLVGHHLACAAALEGRSDADGLERRARHLLAAGALESSLAPLVAAVRARLSAGDYSRASDLLGRWERAARELRLDPADPRRGEGTLLGANLARLMGRLEEAEERAAALLDEVAVHRWETLAARARWESARVAWNRGEAERALRLGQEAEALAVEQGDRAFEAECARDLGSMFAHRGEHARADARFGAARQAFAELGDPVGEAYALLGVGQIAQRERRLEAAGQSFALALERFRAAGSRRGVADCDNSLGELARLRGDLLGAEQSYRAARAGFQAIGSGLVVAPETNLGLVLVERGRYAEAREVLEGALALTRRQGRRVLLGNLHAYLLPTLAGVRDWGDFDRHRVSAEVLLAETGIVEEDIARMAETAGSLAEEAGRGDAARAAYRLAARQWEGLGRPQDADRARARARGAPHTETRR